jgi:hypothetical protein
MTPFWRNVLVVIALVIVFVVVAGTAWSHSWYDGYCCSERDCRQTVTREVERRDEGWFVAITGETIPFDDKRIRHSLDPFIHVCLMGQKIRCLYIPDAGI